MREILCPLNEDVEPIYREDHPFSSRVSGLIAFLGYQMDFELGPMSCGLIYVMTWWSNCWVFDFIVIWAKIIKSINLD